MDGIAFTDKTQGNAVAAAYTPHLDYLQANHPHTNIKAHGTAVGLPDDGDMGNSEVGHNALGCGQIYAQGAKLVNQSIESGAMFKSSTWQTLIKNVVDNTSTLHFIGLLSDGNVHSNIDHLIAMIKKAKEQGITKVRTHILLDGRDVPAQSALEYVGKLETTFKNLNNVNFDAQIASGGGRQVITMDRYGANWQMVKDGWDVHVGAVGVQFGSATDAILAARAKNPSIIDQDLPPFVIAKNGVPIGKMADNDSVILFNFRGDRAIQLSQAFEMANFSHFDRGNLPKVMFAGMLQYDGDLQLPKEFLVQPPKIVNTLTDLLTAHNVRQFAVSETQKFGHMTYFWNGNRTEPVSTELEDWKEITSDVIPFEQRPWMKAAEVTDEVIKAIEAGKYGFIRANFPNGDMVGHTGNYQAAIIAVSAVDLCLGRIIAAAKKSNVTLIITADHGNAEEMFAVAKNGAISPKTAHSLNAAPFIVVSSEKIAIKEGDFGLANVAATVAQFLGIDKHESWEESICKPS